MATTITKYDHLLKLLCNGGSWEGNTVKLALVSSSYTFSAAHTVWADANANELSSGGGYTTGGMTLTNKTSSNTKLDADDVIFANLTKNFRGGILYFSGTIDTLSNPLIAYLLFNDAPADTPVNGTDFSVIWNSNGIMTL